MLLAPAAQAGAASARYCDPTAELAPDQHDRLLRVAALLRQALDASGQALALVARSGLDLRRFGLRHSHAGISLRDGPAGRWAVRQLYYACDEQRPRLFDQGLPGFVSGMADVQAGFLSVVLLPAGPEADALARAALDTPRALTLLAGHYNAIAYPWQTATINCNQWLVELLAEAWATPPVPGGGGGDSHSARTRAQRWLQAAGYVPQAVDVGTPFTLLAASVMPLLQLAEHPPQDRQALRLQVSLPASIEAFVHQRLPAARLLQLCFNTRQVVLREGGDTLPDDCQAAPGDQVQALD